MQNALPCPLLLSTAQETLKKQCSPPSCPGWQGTRSSAQRESPPQGPPPLSQTCCSPSSSLRRSSDMDSKHAVSPLLHKALPLGHRYLSADSTELPSKQPGNSLIPLVLGLHHSPTSVHKVRSLLRAALLSQGVCSFAQQATAAVSLPLRTGLSSTTSSCMRLAVWIISVISASLLCFSVISLHSANVSALNKTADLQRHSVSQDCSRLPAQPNESQSKL